VGRSGATAEQPGAVQQVIERDRAEAGQGGIRPASGLVPKNLEAAASGVTPSVATSLAMAPTNALSEKPILKISGTEPPGGTFGSALK